MCTVMPCAPAFSTTFAASSGRGSVPRRACRNVATWSMLTPRCIAPRPLQISSTAGHASSATAAPCMPRLGPSPRYEKNRSGRHFVQCLTDSI